MGLHTHPHRRILCSLHRACFGEQLLTSDHHLIDFRFQQRRRGERGLPIVGALFDLIVLDKHIKEDKASTPSLAASLKSTSISSDLSARSEAAASTSSTSTPAMAVQAAENAIDNKSEKDRQNKRQHRSGSDRSRKVRLTILLALAVLVEC